MPDWKIALTLGLLAAALGTSGCASIQPETVGALAYQVGYATGQELGAISTEAVESVSDSLVSVMAEAVETEFQRGLSDGLQ